MWSFGISRFYLGDKSGACEDWRMASALGAANAAELIAEYCTKDAAGEKLKPETPRQMRPWRRTDFEIGVRQRAAAF